MNAIESLPSLEEDESELFRDKISGVRQLWHAIGRPLCWHRLRGPALIQNDGTEHWYMHDKPYTPTAHEKMLWEQRKKNESI